MLAGHLTACSGTLTIDNTRIRILICKFNWVKQVQKGTISHHWDSFTQKHTQNLVG